MFPPQHHAAPAAVRAQVCDPPAVMLAKLVGRLVVTARGRMNPGPALDPSLRDKTSEVPTGGWVPNGVAAAVVGVVVTENVGEAAATGVAVPTAVAATVAVPTTVPAGVRVDEANEAVAVAGGVPAAPRGVEAVVWADAVAVVPIESVGGGALMGTDVGVGEAPTSA